MTDDQVQALIDHKRRISGSVKQTEGFWYSKDEPHFPMPVPCPDRVAFKSAVLRLLSLAEEKAHCIQYRGSSSCRLCDLRRNGSYTYVLGGWAWPSGYSHYIDVHNVRPTEEFRKFLTSSAMKAGSDTGQE